MSRASEAVLLKDHLKELRLPTMRRDYAECARQARETRASYEGFLLDLVSRQLEQRRANQLERRLKEARFPVMKTLEKTDLGLWPTLDTVEVRELIECTWINERENVALIGKHGTGKTHAATVLGVEACRRGHRVGFFSASGLVNTLVEAREEKQLERVFRKRSRFHLVIVDELGYIPFSEAGAQLLYQVFSNRYEKASLLVTSNLAFAEWTRVFGDASLTAALLDRLTHRCQIYEFDWESIRLAESLKRQKKMRRERSAKSRPKQPSGPPEVSPDGHTAYSGETGHPIRGKWPPGRSEATLGIS